MGRPKKTKAERKESSPTFSIKSDPPWAAWLTRLAEYAQGSKAEVVEQALIEYARRARFPEVAPPRFEKPTK